MERIKDYKLLVTKMKFNPNWNWQQRICFAHELQQQDLWDKFTEQEKSEILNGNDGKLEARYFQVMARGNQHTNPEIAAKWAFIMLFMVVLEKTDSLLTKEAKYRISDRENPPKVIVEIVDKMGGFDQLVIDSTSNYEFLKGKYKELLEDVRGRTVY